ncbi:GNAT family N-acetyltransferase [Neotabrizicola sp. sgz301269]|uniref:GNAT family N-acetyltransferase n=1 Tax=Neotabrizicola sp. sgz301269 TaxID=3276282 RepID=UPI00376F936D
MTGAPHERPIPGAAAAFATALSAQLPVIETLRLRLRAPDLADFDAWAEIFCGPESAYLGGPFTRDEAFTDYAAATGIWLLRGHGPFTVTTRQGGEVLGFVLIGFEPGDQEPELGYLFRAIARGQGYATEAAAALRDHAFGALGMTRLVSYVAPENAASARLAQRLGARLSGMFDGSQVWLHELPDRRAQRKTFGRQSEDVGKTSKRGG